MVTDVFIKRPVLATVCSVLITLAGAISIPTLPIGRYPELAPPTVSVGAFYTGANAQAVESAVTTPLESVINGVEGMLYMTSASTNNGFSSITVTFEVGRDPDLAAVDVQNRVNSALGRMPLEVRTNGITVSKGSAGFLAGIGFYSDNNRYSSLFISNYLDRYVRDALKRVPGVANVIIFGERRFAMRLVARSEPSRRPRADGKRCHQRAARAERAGGRGLGRRRAVVRRPDVPAQRARGRAADRSARVRRHRRQGRTGRRARARARHRTRRARRRRLLVAAAVCRRRGLGHRHHAAADGERARSVPRRQRRDGSAWTTSFRRD